MAANYSNLDSNSFQKSNVIDSTGSPVVDIVVGTIGMPEDVVWAGNIAAKVAQMAVTPASGGTTSEKTVDLIVGGTQTVSGGARELTTAALSSTTNANEYTDSIGNTYFKNFANATYTATRDGNTTFSENVAESIGVSLDARMNATDYLVKDLVADVDAGDVNYTMTVSNMSLGTLPFTDTGSDDYIPVSFMGTRYVLDYADATSIVLVSDNAEQIYNVDDTITGIKARDSNAVYSLKFTAGLSSGSAYIARVALLDASGAKVDEQTFSANSDIVFRNSVGQEILASKVRLKSIYTNGSSTDITYSFSALVGTDRMEIRNGREVPYDPNYSGSNRPWIATVANTTTGLSVILANSSYYKTGSTPLYSTEYSFNPTGKTTAFNLFEGTGLANAGKVVFKGFYDTGVQKSTVSFKKGNGSNLFGSIDYTDTTGRSHVVPMAIKLDTTDRADSISSFVFDGVTHAYSTSSKSSPATFYVKEKVGADSNILNLTPTTVGLATADVNYTQAVTLYGGNDETYTYLAKTSSTANYVYLVLAGYDSNATPNANLAGFAKTTNFTTGKVWFLGTDLDDASSTISTTLADYNRGNPSADTKSYYYPDAYDFMGAQPGTSSGTYKTAVFKIQEEAGSMPADLADGAAYVYVDTEGGNAGTVDTANITKLNYTGKTTAVEYYGNDQNLTTFSEYLGNAGDSSANYKQAYTDRGTKIVLGNREVAFTLPSAAMKSFFSVQSNDVTTSTTGGETFTGVAAGETKTTAAGTTIKVDSIAGTATGTGVIVHPVTNLVKSDKASSFGKSILVGGWMANTKVTKSMMVGTQTLESRLTAQGDYVSAVLEDGSIIVAGWTATDTATAAQALITALDSLA